MKWGKNKGLKLKDERGKPGSDSIYKRSILNNNPPCLVESARRREEIFKQLERDKN